MIPRISGKIPEIAQPSVLRISRKPELYALKHRGWISNEKPPNKENPKTSCFTGVVHEIVKEQLIFLKLTQINEHIVNFQILHFLKEGIKLSLVTSNSVWLRLPKFLILFATISLVLGWPVFCSTVDRNKGFCILSRHSTHWAASPALQIHYVSHYFPYTKARQRCHKKRKL